MKRTKLKNRKLPDYTRGEEIVNMIIHIIGGSLSVAALVLCIVFSALRHDVYRVVGSALYGGTLITLYTVSSVYHGLKPGMGKKVMQVIDKCSIYLLIVGTFIPILFGPIREQSLALCWTLLGIVLGVCAFGCTFCAIDFKKYDKFSLISYIGIGLVTAIFFRQFYAAITFGGLLFLLAGCIVFILGSIIDRTIDSKRYIHTLSHVLIILGTVSHFFAILIYCIIK